MRFLGDPDQSQWSKISRIMVHQRNRLILFFYILFLVPLMHNDPITDPEQDHPKGSWALQKQRICGDLKGFNIRAPLLNLPWISWSGLGRGKLSVRKINTKQYYLKKYSSAYFLFSCYMYNERLSPFLSVLFKYSHFTYISLFWKTFVFGKYGSKQGLKSTIANTLSLDNSVGNPVVLQD